MTVFKDIGNFFSKEIPKFVTKTIPSVFKPETYAPDLVPLRKSVAALKKKVTSDREKFYASQAKLQAARSRYVELSDTFTEKGGRAAEISLPKMASLTKELNATEKTLRDIAKASRTITGIATLGLAELAYVHADIAEERGVLNRQRTILSGTSKRLSKAIKQVASAQGAVDAQISWIESKLAEAGIEPGPSAASDLKAAEAETQARQSMAARLLGLGTDRQTIIDLTGLSSDVVDTLSPIAPDDDDDDNDGLLTEEEKQALADSR